mmetsp:Transcript_25549/g.37741  ORF Transcript_25549/g.37741 Transcript_25549/m.37741 type:complete len:917 (+) Transcript_25549:144-2894(+)
MSLKVTPLGPLGGKANFDHSLNLLRLTLMCCLFATAAIGGYFSYTLMRADEDKVEKLSFKSLTDHMKRYCKEGFAEKLSALNSIQSLLKTSCPTTASWPNCTVDIEVYDRFVNSLITMADIRGCNHEVKIHPRQILSFIKYTSDFYSASGFPDLAESIRQQGIFAVNQSTNKVYTVTEPYSYGENDLILPIVQINNPSVNRGALLFNIYSDQDRIDAIDPIFECIRRYDGSMEGTEMSVIAQECTGMSRVIHLVEDVEFRPASFLHHPVMLPITNSSDLEPDVASSSIIITLGDQEYIHVGSITALFNWDEMLTKSVFESTEGLHVVLNDERNEYCFTFVDGRAVYAESGCKIEKQYKEDRVKFPVSFLDNIDFTYTVTIYRDETYSKVFHGNGPIYTSAITVAVIIACMVQFVGYDVVVTKRTLENDEAKRNFVRYISHEMRTPLTTVSLGIKLVAREIQSLLPANATAIDDRRTVANVDRPIQVSREKLDDFSALLENIGGSTDAAVLILNDLLQYDRIKFGNIDMNFEILNVMELMLTTTRLFEIQAVEAGVSLTFDTETSDEKDCEIRRHSNMSEELNNAVREAMRKESDLSASAKSFSAHDSSSLQSVSPSTRMMALCIHGDDSKLRQVIRNLISNALKFTKAGGFVDVSVKWNRDGLPHVNEVVSQYQGTHIAEGSVVITVRDSGVGLSQENIDNVFKEGWQFKTNKLQAGQGSGLGLWIAKSIVEHHHGTISCSSAGEGCGTSFVVELPVFVPVVSSTPSTKKLEYFPFTAPNRSERCLQSTSPLLKTVLVVDDSAMCRKVVCRLLQGVGVTCLEAVDGEECISKVIENSDTIDAIVMDYEMPRMNGPTAAKILREKGYTIPIIGLTGNVLKADTAYFLEHGASAVMHKPVSLEQLMSVIGSATAELNV